MLGYFCTGPLPTSGAVGKVSPTAAGACTNAGAVGSVEGGAKFVSYAVEIGIPVEICDVGWRVATVYIVGTCAG